MTLEAVALSVPKASMFVLIQGLTLSRTKALLSSISKVLTLS